MTEAPEGLGTADNRFAPNPESRAVHAMVLPVVPKPRRFGTKCKVTTLVVGVVLLLLSFLLLDLLRVFSIRVQVSSAKTNLQASDHAGEPSVLTLLELRLSDGPRSLSGHVNSGTCSLFTKGRAAALLSVSLAQNGGQDGPEQEMGPLPLAWSSPEEDAEEIHAALSVHSVNIPMLRALASSFAFDTNEHTIEEFGQFEVDCKFDVAVRLFGVHLGSHSLTVSKTLELLDNSPDGLSLLRRAVDDAANSLARNLPEIDFGENAFTITVPIPYTLSHEDPKFAETRSFEIQLPRLNYDAFFDLPRFAAILPRGSPQHMVANMIMQQLERMGGPLGVNVQLLTRSIDLANNSPSRTLTFLVEPIVPLSKRQRACISYRENGNGSQPGFPVEIVPCVPLELMNEHQTGDPKANIGALVSKSDLITAFVGEHNTIAISSTDQDVKGVNSLRLASDPFPAADDPAAIRHCVGVYINLRQVEGFVGCMKFVLNDSMYGRNDPDRGSFLMTLELNANVRERVRFNSFVGFRMDDNLDPSADPDPTIIGQLRYELTANGLGHFASNATGQLLGQLIRPQWGDVQGGRFNFTLVELGPDYTPEASRITVNLDADFVEPKSTSIRTHIYRDAESFSTSLLELSINEDWVMLSLVEDGVRLDKDPRVMLNSTVGWAVSAGLLWNLNATNVLSHYGEELTSFQAAFKLDQPDYIQKVHFFVAEGTNLNPEATNGRFYCDYILTGIPHASDNIDLTLDGLAFTYSAMSSQKARFQLGLHEGDIHVRAEVLESPDFSPTESSRIYALADFHYVNIEDKHAMNVTIDVKYEDSEYTNIVLGYDYTPDPNDERACFTLLPSTIHVVPLFFDTQLKVCWDITGDVISAGVPVFSFKLGDSISSVASLSAVVERDTQKYEVHFYDRQSPDDADPRIIFEANGRYDVSSSDNIALSYNMSIEREGSPLSHSMGQFGFDMIHERLRVGLNITEGPKDDAEGYRLRLNSSVELVRAEQVYDLAVTGLMVSDWFTGSADLGWQMELFDHEDSDATGINCATRLALSPRSVVVTPNESNLGTQVQFNLSQPSRDQFSFVVNSTVYRYEETFSIASAQVNFTKADGARVNVTISERASEDHVRFLADYGALVDSNVDIDGQLIVGSSYACRHGFRMEQEESSMRHTHFTLREYVRTDDGEEFDRFSLGARVNLNSIGDIYEQPLDIRTQVDLYIDQIVSSAVDTNLTVVRSTTDEETYIVSLSFVDFEKEADVEPRTRLSYASIAKLEPSNTSVTVHGNATINYSRVSQCESSFLFVRRTDFMEDTSNHTLSLSVYEFVPEHVEPRFVIDHHELFKRGREELHVSSNLTLDAPSIGRSTIYQAFTYDSDRSFAVEGGVGYRMRSYAGKFNGTIKSDDNEINAEVGGLITVDQEPFSSPTAAFSYARDDVVLQASLVMNEYDPKETMAESARTHLKSRFVLGSDDRLTNAWYEHQVDYQGDVLSALNANCTIWPHAIESNSNLASFDVQLQVAEAPHTSLLLEPEDNRFYSDALIRIPRGYNAILAEERIALWIDGQPYFSEEAEFRFTFEPEHQKTISARVAAGGNSNSDYHDFVDIGLGLTFDFAAFPRFSVALPSIFISVANHVYFSGTLEVEIEKFDDVLCHLTAGYGDSRIFTPYSSIFYANYTLARASYEDPDLRSTNYTLWGQASLDRELRTNGEATVTVSRGGDNNVMVTLNLREAPNSDISDIDDARLSLKSEFNLARSDHHHGNDNNHESVYDWRIVLASFMRVRGEFISYFDTRANISLARQSDSEYYVTSDTLTLNASVIEAPTQGQTLADSRFGLVLKSAFDYHHESPSLKFTLQPALVYDSRPLSNSTFALEVNTEPISGRLTLYESAESSAASPDALRLVVATAFNVTNANHNTTLAIHSTTWFQGERYTNSAVQASWDVDRQAVDVKYDDVFSIREDSPHLRAHYIATWASSGGTSIELIQVQLNGTATYGDRHSAATTRVDYSRTLNSPKIRVEFVEREARSSTERCYVVIGFLADRQLNDDQNGDTTDCVADYNIVYKNQTVSRGNMTLELTQRHADGYVQGMLLWNLKFDEFGSSSLERRVGGDIAGAWLPLQGPGLSITNTHNLTWHNKVLSNGLTKIEFEQPVIYYVDGMVPVHKSDGKLEVYFHDLSSAEYSVDQLRNAFSLTFMYYGDLPDEASATPSDLALFLDSFGVSFAPSFKYPTFLGLLVTADYSTYIRLLLGVTRSTALSDILLASTSGHEDQLVSKPIGLPPSDIARGFETKHALSAFLIAQTRWDAGIGFEGTIQVTQPPSDFTDLAGMSDWYNLSFDASISSSYSEVVEWSEPSDGVRIEVELSQNVPGARLLVREKGLIPDGKHYNYMDDTPGRFKTVTVLPVHQFSDVTNLRIRVEVDSQFIASNAVQVRIRATPGTCDEWKCNGNGNCVVPALDRCECKPGYFGSDCSTSKDQSMAVDQVVTRDFEPNKPVTYGVTLPQAGPTYRLRVRRNNIGSTLVAMIQKGQIPTRDNNIATMYVTEGDEEVELYFTTIDAKPEAQPLQMMRSSTQSLASVTDDSSEYFIALEIIGGESTTLDFDVKKSECDSPCHLGSTCDSTTKQCVCMPGRGFADCSVQAKRLVVGGDALEGSRTENFFAWLRYPDARPWGIAVNVIKTALTPMELIVTEGAYPTSQGFQKKVKISENDLRVLRTIYVNSADVSFTSPLYFGMSDATVFSYNVAAEPIFCENDCSHHGTCDVTTHVCECEPTYSWTLDCGLQVLPATTAFQKQGILWESESAVLHLTEVKQCQILTMQFSRGELEVNDNPTVLVGKTFVGSADDAKYAFENGSPNLVATYHTKDTNGTVFVRLVASDNNSWSYSVSISEQVDPDCNPTPSGGRNADTGLIVGIIIGILAFIGIIWFVHRRGYLKRLTCCRPRRAQVDDYTILATPGTSLDMYYTQVSVNSQPRNNIL